MTSSVSCDPPMLLPFDPPCSPEHLFAQLKALGIAYHLYEHKPIFTVAEGKAIEQGIPGAHCRNLFLKDKKDRLLLLTVLNETGVDLKALSLTMGYDRFSFASPGLLVRHLGVEPGSVTPFAVINDRRGAVPIALDRGMMRHDRVCVHPLVNHMTLSVRPNDLIAFLRACHHEPVILDL